MIVAHTLNSSTVQTERIAPSGERSFHTTARRTTPDGRTALLYEKYSSTLIEALRRHQAGQAQAAHVEIAMWRMQAEHDATTVVPEYVRDAAQLIGLSEDFAHDALSTPMDVFLRVLDEHVAVRMRGLDAV